jgi:hypothetical protein
MLRHVVMFRVIELFLILQEFIGATRKLHGGTMKHIPDERL